MRGLPLRAPLHMRRHIRRARARAASLYYGAAEWPRYMKKPVAGRVSIVIPVYNREEYIAEAVDSALNQTYGDTEVIVVDDGSTDGTAAILGKYGDQIRVARHAENAGVGAAVSTGVGMMTGEWLHTLGSDDALYPDAVERMNGANAALGNDSRIIPFMSLANMAGNERCWPPGPMLNALDPLGQAVLLMERFFAPHGTCQFRKELVDEIGYNPAYRTSEDWDFNLRLLLKGYRFKHVERMIYGYRVHDGQMSRQAIGHCERQQRRQFNRMIESALSSLGDADRRAVRSAHARYRRRRLFLYGKWLAANPQMVPEHPGRPRGRAAAVLGGALRRHPWAWAARYSLHRGTPWPLAGALSWHAGSRGDRWKGRGLKDVSLDITEYGMAPRDSIPSHIVGEEGEGWQPRRQ